MEKISFFLYINVLKVLFLVSNNILRNFSHFPIKVEHAPAIKNKY